MLLLIHALILVNICFWYTWIPTLHVYHNVESIAMNKIQMIIHINLKTI